jgi:predicted nucleic acid-binding protein
MPGQRKLVINTGPILALAAAKQLSLLNSLFSRVIVPVEVVREITAGGRTQFAREEFAAAATWMDQRQTDTLVPPFLATALDLGEASVIALAQTENVATVCIDETLGRRYARLHGLGVTGSLGILLRAKKQGSDIKVREAIALMRRHGIWLSPTIEAEALRLAGE